MPPDGVGSAISPAIIERFAQCNDALFNLDTWRARIALGSFGLGQQCLFATLAVAAEKD